MRCGQHQFVRWCVVSYTLLCCCFARGQDYRNFATPSAQQSGQYLSGYQSPFATNSYFAPSTAAVQSSVPRELPTQASAIPNRLPDQVAALGKPETAQPRARLQSVRVAQRDDSRDDLLTGQIIAPPPVDQSSATKTNNAATANGSGNSNGKDNLNSATSIFSDAQPDVRYNGTYSALPTATGNAATQLRTTGKTTDGKTAEETKPWAISATQTFDYVKNLALPNNILPNNTVVLQNDWQYQTTAQGQYRLWSEDDSSLVGYGSYYQSVHPRITQQDLNLFSTGLTYSHKFNESILGSVGYGYSYYILDEQTLFSSNRLSPGIQWRANKCVDYQASYSFADNNYRSDPLQTSTADFLQIQRTRYINEDHSHYWFLGYQYGFNHAEFDSYAFEVRSCFLGSRFYLDDCKHNDLYSVISYGNYGYLGFDVVEPTVIRNDDIVSITTRLTHTFSDHFSTYLLYTFSKTTSTVMRQNYNSELYSLGLTLTW